MVKKVVNKTLSLYLFIGISFLFIQCTFKRYAEKSYDRAQKEKPFDVIIIPGIPYDKENTSVVLKMRLYWAKLLYDSAITRNIIFSGSAVYTPFVEGIAMKVIADSLGIPSQHTFSETKAEHSTENVYYSWKLAKRMGFKKIAVATDPFQARMLQSFIKKHTPGVKIIPVVLDMLNVKEKELPIIDTTSAHVTNFVSIKKRESFWKRMRGTFGKRVLEEKRLEARRRKKEGLAKE